MSIHALVFDVDGTLADTEEAHRVAFNLAFERCRLDWRWSPAQYRDLLAITGGKERLAHHLSTLPLDAAEQRRLQRLLPRLHAEKTRFYGAVVADGAVPLRDGVARLLDEAVAAGCRLAIASTTTGTNIDALLRATLGPGGIDRFEVVACGDQVPAKKPAPDIYRLALQRLGLAASEAVAFEDSPNGLRAARAAGLWTVVTPSYWTRGGDFAGADLLLPSLGDPARPLAGEPGGALQRHAWLGLDELLARAGPTSASAPAGRPVRPAASTTAGVPP